MQDPNEDTQWNDILRAKGIIPQKEEAEVTEDQIVDIVEQSVQQKANGGICSTVYCIYTLYYVHVQYVVSQN